MCNPMIFAAALAVVTTVVQTRAQNKAADEQSDAIAAQATTNRAALADRAVEVTDKAEMEKFEIQKQTQRKVSAERVAQSEAGIGGNLQKRSLMASLIGGGQDLAMVDKQEKTLHKQIGRQMDAVSAGEALQMSGLKWTSGLSAGLSAASAGGSAFAAAGGKFDSNPFTQ